MKWFPIAMLMSCAIAPQVHAQYIGQQVYPIAPNPTFSPDIEMGNHDTRIIDMNGDGHMDIVSWETDYFVLGSTHTKARPMVSINDGEGHLIPIENESLEGLWGNNFSLGDIDGDGDFDLVLTLTNENGGATYIRYFLNDGDGHFGEETNLGLSGLPVDFQYHTVMTDIDDDGLDDLIVLASGNMLRIYINVGDGEFETSQSFPGLFISNYFETKLFLSDLTGDGFDEIITNNHIFYNEGDGNFSMSEYFFGSHEGFVAAGDVDGNGVNDLIYHYGFEDPDDNYIYHYEIKVYYFGEDTPGIQTIFEGATWDGLPAGIPTGVYDINQDGLNDVLYYSEPQGDYYTSSLLNNGDGTFTQYDVIDEFQMSQGDYLIAGDLTGNGVNEIVLGRNAKVYGLNENQEWEHLSGTPFDEHNPGFGFPIDIDGDGDTDLLKLDDANPYTTVELDFPDLLYRNDGTGHFIRESFTNQNLSENIANGLAIDVDLDGDEDFIAMNGFGQDEYSAVLLNDGLGNFEETQVGFTNSYYSGLYKIDVNQDGYGDFVQLRNGFEVYLNNGSGQFQSLFNEDLDFSHENLLVEDFNNDSYPDILYTGSVWGENSATKLFLNDNGVGFTTFENHGINPFGNPSVSSGDFNNDGSIDILINGNLDDIGDYTTRIFTNNGDGTFETNTNDVFLEIRFRDIASGDFDGDGDVDIVSYHTPPFIPLPEPISGAIYYQNEGSLNFEAFIIEDILKNLWLPNFFVFDGNSDGADDLGILGYRTPNASPYQRLFLSQYILSNSNPIHKNAIQIYPNPAREWLEISTDQPVNATVFDINGAVVLKENQIKRIEVSTLPSGLYIIEIFDSENGVSRKKFVID